MDGKGVCVCVCVYGGRDGSFSILTVAWLQSVGMCRCVAGVAGAALEAVLVLLFLAIADAVHTVGLDGRELHALDIHLCKQDEKTQELFWAMLEKQITCGETVYF